MSRGAKRHSNHDRPLHALDVDFDDLAQHAPEWAAISQSAKEAKWLDFQDPKVVRQLTRSILRSKFNLTIELPDDRLCPPVSTIRDEAPLIIGSLYDPAYVSLPRT